MTIKIASWNVNSIKARLAHVKTWLETHQPDLLLIQELKGLDFPTSEFDALGYHSEAVTQKAYNGVAILAKDSIRTVLDHLPGDPKDEQSRYLEIDYGDLRVINIYLPNGNPAPGEKYAYKLSWMDRLYDRLKILRQEEVSFVIGGDFNVIPEERDCYDPKAWSKDALYLPETKTKFRALLNLGLIDAFRVNITAAEHYTFWDYQAGAWPKNNGIRIDHFLLSPPVTDRLLDCQIDSEPRGQEKASDHTPILIELAA